jgi:hypothetical protein
MSGNKMRNTNLARKSVKLINWTLPVVGSILFTGAAHAAIQPVTFAQASETAGSTDPNIFAYNNNGPSGDAEFGTQVGGVFGAAAPINFTFLSGAVLIPAALDLAGVQNATISMTSSTTNDVSTAFGGTFADQHIDGSGKFTDVIRITRNTPAAEGAGSRTNLLTVTFTGDLTGPIGGTTPTLSADSTTNDTVTYTSDFVNFAQSTVQDFSMAFSSWDPLVTPPTGLGVNADNYYNSATTAGAATFDFQIGSNVIPEPTSFSLLGLVGLVMLPAMARKLRRPATLSSVVS